MQSKYLSFRGLADAVGQLFQRLSSWGDSGTPEAISYWGTSLLLPPPPPGCFQEAAVDCVKDDESQILPIRPSHIRNFTPDTRIPT